MTPEQRATCLAIDLRARQINTDINDLYATQRMLQEERQSLRNAIARKKQEIARRLQDLATVCLPGARRGRDRRNRRVAGDPGIIDCIIRAERIRRDIAELRAQLRTLEQRLESAERRLETIRRKINGVEALLPILRRQKAAAGCP